jgi:hypothetical protein
MTSWRSRYNTDRSSVSLAPLFEAERERDELRAVLHEALAQNERFAAEIQGLKNVAFDLVQEHLAEIRRLERENKRLQAELDEMRRRYD